MRVWMEDVAGDRIPDWSPARCVGAVRHLAHWQRRGGDRPPDRIWFARAQLATTLERRDAVDGWPEYDVVVPAARPVWGQLERLWDLRLELLGRLNSAPSLLCHGDLHRGNLLAGEAVTVALDWGHLGVAHPGEDLAQFVLSLSLTAATAEEFEPIERALATTYEQELASVVARADVRFGYDATLVLGYLSRLRWAVRHDALDEDLPW